MAIKEDLLTIETNIVARLKEITENPKPSYSIDGQEIRWTPYFDSLWSALQKVRDQLDREDGPFEEITKVFT